MSAGDRAEQTLAAGIVHQRAGRLADAERLYRIASEADPRNARAFHLWGVVAHHLKRPDASSLVARLEEMALTRQIQEMKGRLQRLNPVEAATEYNRAFGDLIVLEQRKKALRERGVGAV